jgi:hypothetical protein
MDDLVVLRIQDPDGRGPWKPGFSRQWVEERPDHENLPPWFVEFGRVDRLVLVGDHVGSACRTLEQLRRWFTPGEYATLLRLGYRAVRLRVGRILAESNRQCVFGRARPLREDVEPVELYDHNALRNADLAERRRRP